MSLVLTAAYGCELHYVLKVHIYRRSVDIFMYICIKEHINEDSSIKSHTGVGVHNHKRCTEYLYRRSAA